jgi:hypothetical protein
MTIRTHLIHLWLRSVVGTRETGNLAPRGFTTTPQTWWRGGESRHTSENSRSRGWEVAASPGGRHPLR